MSERAAIVLAAGKSTRMKSDLPKVLHELCGRPMLAYVLAACRLAGAERLLVVVGHDRESVMRRFDGESDIEWVHQREQNGTGHAVLCCREALAGFTGSVLVLAGDMPLVRREVLAELVETLERTGDGVTLATTVLDDPTGYGRIVRDEEGRLEAIVEQSECLAEQREIREVNPSYYCFDAEKMFSALEEVSPSGSKGECYLTDAIGILRKADHGASALVQSSPEDSLGVNSRLDLAKVGRVMQDRIQFQLMSEGVTIVDPDTTWIEADVTIGRDTVVYPFTLIETGGTIGAQCRIGPFARISAKGSIEDGACVGSSPCQEVSGG